MHQRNHWHLSSRQRKRKKYEITRIANNPRIPDRFSIDAIFFAFLLLSQAKLEETRRMHFMDLVFIVEDVD